MCYKWVQTWMSNISHILTFRAQCKIHARFKSVLLIPMDQRTVQCLGRKLQIEKNLNVLQIRYCWMREYFWNSNMQLCE